MDEAHSKYKTAHNKYVNTIKKSKKDHWEDFPEQIYEKTIWTVHKYASAEASDGGSTRVPILTTKLWDNTTWTASTNDEKAKILFDTFFPAPNKEQTTASNEPSYPNNVFEYEPITDKQIKRAVIKLNPFKVPGANGIPNAVIKQCTDILIPYLGPLSRVTFELKVYPSEWTDSVTWVVRKPGKADHTTPGAYCPIALLDTIGKVLSSCVVEDLVKMAEIHQLIPKDHYGCRPGQTTTDTLHYVIVAAKDAWQRGNKTAILFPDIKGAFPSVIL